MKLLEISYEEYRAHYINLIADQYPELRQKSKSVTFALQYAGTEHTLVSNSGFTLNEAKIIVKRYHETYAQSTKCTKDKIIQATKDGFVTLAFGLRLRTPILAQVIYGDNMPYKAAEESRTAGNAISQSWGILNLRTLVKFMERVWASEYRYKIRPVCSIHDATYVIAENTVGCVKFVNDNLIAEMQWQDLPEIKHDVVKLGGALDIFYPSWANAITLKNNASKCEILKACKGK